MLKTGNSYAIVVPKSTLEYWKEKYQQAIEKVIMELNGTTITIRPYVKGELDAK
jgi:antitoxin component of MazEF toxin-antitoxin module